MKRKRIKILTTAIAMCFYAQLTAQGCFTSFNHTVGAFGITQFTSTSIPSTGVTFNWTLPGATPSFTTGPNPIVTYTSNGVNIALLTVSVTSSTCVATYTQFVVVGTASCALNPAFTWSAGPNGSVNFTNLSAGSSTSTNWTWSFGGSAGFSTTPNPTATYSANGNYSVVLTASNNPSCYASVMSVVTVTNICNLNASFNYAQTAGGGIIYSNSSTGTLSSTSYSWHFGDTTHAYIPSPAHTYSAPGIYTVTLTASNGASCISSNTLAVSVCSLDFIATPSVGGMVHLSGQASPTNSSTYYYWYFGDGGSGQGITANPVMHTYTASGTYSVTFGISSSVPMCSVNITNTISVNCAPAAAFSFSQGVNGTVMFFNNSTNTVSGSYYFWDFGDGDSTTIHSPVHIYPMNSIYIATLTAFNGMGCVSTATMLIPVNSYSCNADFNYVVTNGIVSFTSTSVPQTSVSEYKWDFGNGSNTLAIGISTAVTAYTASGGYTVFHIFKTPTACIDSAIKVIQITNPCPLTASFTSFEDSTGTLFLTNLTTGTNSSTSYSWHSGDGQFANTQHGVFTYTANGTYIVTLTVHNQGTLTCSSTYTAAVHISSVPCVANSSFTHTHVTGGMVNFSSFSSLFTGPGYYWNFGDGTTGTGPQPSHTYLNGGAHQITHIVTRDSLCADTTVQSINITGIACLADPGFTLFPSGVPHHWTAIPDYPWNVVAAEWQWGDGSASSSLYASHQYAAPGNYVICLTVTVSCAQSSSACTSHSVYRMSEASQMVYVNVERPGLIPAGIADAVRDESVIIYPNPTAGEIFIRATPNVALEELRVFDVTGREVFRQQLIEIHAGETGSLTLALPEGLYYTQVKFNGGTAMSKILIKD